MRTAEHSDLPSWVPCWGDEEDSGFRAWLRYYDWLTDLTQPTYDAKDIDRQCGQELKLRGISLGRIEITGNSLPSCCEHSQLPLMSVERGVRHSDTCGMPSTLLDWASFIILAAQKASPSEWLDPGSKLFDAVSNMCHMTEHFKVLKEVASLDNEIARVRKLIFGLIDPSVTIRPLKKVHSEAWYRSHWTKLAGVKLFSLGDAVGFGLEKLREGDLVVFAQGSGFPLGLRQEGEFTSFSLSVTYPQPRASLP